MTPEKETELFAQLNLILELQRRTDSDVRELRSEMRQLQATSQDTNSRLSRVEGRIEEQSKFLQLVLASRQPRRAVGQ